MKLFMYCVSALCVVLGIVQAQPGWQFLNPRPQGNSLFGVHQFSPGRAVAIGEGATVLWTDDGGASWVRQSVSYTASFKTMYDVYFIDENIGFIMCYSGVILRTTDGGLTWTTPTTNTTSILFAAHFPDAMNGYIAGSNGKVLKTTDAGATWTELRASYTTLLRQPFFVDASLGMVTGTGGAVFRTTNGGVTWDSSNVGAVTQVWGIHMFDASNVLVAADNGYIYKTTNAGAAWDTVSTGGIYSGWLDMYFINSTTGFVVGGGGDILKTTDGGQTWNPKESNVPLTLEDISFSDPMNGFAVGRVGEMTKTTDGGETWTAVSASSMYDLLYGIHFANANVGTIVGHFGAIYRTTDGGTTWAEQTSDATGALTSVQMVDENTATMVGNDGVFRTTNGGVTWGPQTVSNISSIRGLCFLNKDTGYISGFNGQVRYTTDGGAVWLNQTSNSSQWLWGIAFSSKDTGIIVGDQGGIIRTTGSGWLPQTSPVQSPLYSVAFANDSVVVAVGYYGIIIRSTNAGQQWDTISSPTWRSLRRIRFSGSTGYAAAEDGRVLKTTDAGLTWQEHVTELGFGDFEDVFVFSENDAMVAGGNGIIMRTANGGMNLPFFAADSPLNFGTVSAGSAKKDSVLVTNAGADTLKITLIASTNAKFAHTPAAMTLVSGNSKYVVVTFSPLDNSLQEGHLIFTHSAAGSPDSVAISGQGIVTGVESDRSAIPAEFSLSQNYPNPFNPTTAIGFDLPHKTFVTLKVYDMLGREAATLVNEERNTGRYSVQFDATSLSTGVYVYTLRAGNFVTSKKLLLMK